MDFWPRLLRGACWIEPIPVVFVEDVNYVFRTSVLAVPGTLVVFYA